MAAFSCISPESTIRLGRFCALCLGREDGQDLRSLATGRQRAMKFGLLSQLQVPKPWAEDTERNIYWQNLDHAVAAEHAGFSHFWLTEQHFFAEIGHCASPEMFLAALSQRTKQIRLGFAVILMPCHNPFMIAERVATLDVLSNGRCEFGAGRGTAAYVVEGLGFNADADHSREVGREALEAVVRMLEAERFPGY